MALDFPPSPSVGYVYTYEGRSWQWNGYAWDKTSAAGISGSYVSQLNGLSGGVNVAGGTSISVTPTGNTLTIAYTGGGGGGATGATGATGAGGALGYWGSFWSTQDQAAAGTTLAYAITYNNTDPNSNGVSIVSNSRITFSNSGVYNIQFSAQADRISGSGTDTIEIWFRKNGSDVPDSNGIITVSGNAAAAKTIAAWNYMFNITANDYVELMWRTSDTRLEFIADPAGTNPTRPAIPSVILSANQVMYTQLGPTGPAGPTGTIGVTNGSGIGLSVSGNTLTVSNTGVHSFNGLTGAIQGVSSVNGSTGSITNVAKTNAVQTFTDNQIFTSGISASGGITLSTVNIVGNLNITGQLMVDGVIITKTAFYGFTGDADEEPIDFVDLDGGSY